MELWESAGGLRWAIGRAGAMAVNWLQIAKTAGRAMGRTELDVHLIKTGGTGDNINFGRTDVAFRRDSEHGGHGFGRNPCISDLAITALAVIWLQKQPAAQISK
jgi:hypothetical protein